MYQNEELINTNKERFISLCRENIHRDGIDELLRWLECSDFFTAPASTKFHGNYAGGLCEHSLNVYDVAVKIQKAMAPHLSDESIAIIALLHDICKVNFYKTGFKNVKGDDGKWEKKEVWEIKDQFPIGHGEKSVVLLNKFIQLQMDEMLAVRWHMGGFDTAVQGGDYGCNNAKEFTPLVSLIQAADLLASDLLEHTV